MTKIVRSMSDPATRGIAMKRVSIFVIAVAVLGAVAIPLASGIFGFRDANTGSRMSHLPGELHAVQFAPQGAPAMRVSDTSMGLPEATGRDGRRTPVGPIPRPAPPGNTSQTALAPSIVLPAPPPGLVDPATGVISLSENPSQMDSAQGPSLPRGASIDNVIVNPATGVITLMKEGEQTGGS
jgi:hypothetical protein